MSKTRIVIKDPKSLKLTELVASIVDLEEKIPCIEGVVSLFGDEHEEYGEHLQSLKKRQSALYAEVKRREELYER
ncbi:hypothetical protein CMI42_05885 [Candidatus Pacearchaeota archaeon]|nr:hypothetical protein [Candidatus Pacearchaeota archaeon]